MSMVIKMKLALHLPINSVSFGQVSTLLLRTLFEREKAGNPIDFCLFPIGQADLSSQQIEPQFAQWLQNKINIAFESHNRTTPLFKLWHLNGSLESFSNHQRLLSFYELDNPTKIEINIAKNNKMAFTSKYTQNVFRLFGVDSTYIPLAFDSYNFKVIPKKYHTDDRIVFNLCGKLEKRKHHAKVIQAWIKKYGKNAKYALQCATYNGFLNEQQNNELVRQIIGGDKPFNVVFYPAMKENVIYNDFLNSSHIVIGMSGGEGWGLPEFHSVAMGKYAVLLNAHAYTDWAKPEMATFVQPSGKVSSVDNVFFRQGEPFNQGNIFDWNEDEFISACEDTVKKYQASPINAAGLSLQQQYTKENLLDSILKFTLE